MEVDRVKLPWITVFVKWKNKRISRLCRVNCPGLTVVCIKRYEKYLVEFSNVQYYVTYLYNTANYVLWPV